MESPEVQLTISEDEATQLQSRIQIASPFSVFGPVQVTAHVSPIEFMRVSGVPRNDLQFTLSTNDNGVLK